MRSVTGAVATGSRSGGLGLWDKLRPRSVSLPVLTSLALQVLAARQLSYRLQGVKSLQLSCPAARRTYARKSAARTHAYAASVLMAEPVESYLEDYARLDHSHPAMPRIPEAYGP